MSVMTASIMPRSLRISTVYLLLGMLLVLVRPGDAVDACDVCDCSDPTNIDCQDRELEEVPTNFPQEAQAVILSNNRISRVPLNAFVDLADLLFVYLHSNALTNLEEGTFDNIPNLIEVYMRDNPFQCDCNLRWLASWVQSTGSDILKDDPQCLSPGNLNGQSLTSVDVREMICPTTPAPPVTEATTEAPPTPALATWCPEEESVLFTWPRTFIDTTARVTCPEGDGTAIRECVWSFGEGAAWSTPNITTCFSNRVTQRLSELAYLPPERVLDNIDELQTWTSWADQFTLVDTALAAKTLSAISAAPSLDTQQCSTTLQCISNLMQADEEQLLEAQRMYNSVSMLMSVMEPMTFNTMFDGDTFVTTAGDIAIGLGVFQTIEFPGAAFVKQTTDDRRSYQSDQEFEIFLNDVSDGDLGGFSSIKLPTTLLDQVILSEPPTVQFTFYRSGKMFDLVSQADGNSSFSMMELQVPIISATVGGMHVTNLHDPVQVNFRRLTTTGTPVCVFWDTSANDWSREGCQLASDQHGLITCQCNHLTNFAVLMDIYGNIDNISDADLTALMIISYVGCAISMFGIAATLLTYSLFRKLRRDNPTKILMNLCLALLLAILFFVCSGPAHNSGSRGACVTVAVMLHYFLLTSMAWMGLEALNLYLAIMKVFNTYYRHFMLKFCIAGWGSPAVVVAITLAVNVDNYTQYGGICWLQPNAFYGAFLTPVCLVLILNCVMFGLVIRQLVGGAANEFKKADKVETTTKLRGAIGLVILLGLTWVLAIFAIAEASLTFSYLFAIVNSLQGMFIFVFHCVLKKDVQNHWKTILPCAPKGRPGTPSAWTGSKSMSTPSQLHRSSRVSDINIKAFHAMTIEDAGSHDDFNSIGQSGSDNADDTSESGSRPTTASGIRLDTSFRSIDFQAYSHPPITDYCNPPSPIPEASRECSDESTSVYDIETINDISEA
ncbi:adhesion G-protein coupled receptor G6-like isoform X1 [Branchiostoma lanceolatum]|uniref:adhesion G-protein coupled receptor G6-like isoform X1 n=1 Tax=Branchiostoma lanceolatum TaxID=7740 RepID=UPI0034572A23